MEPVPGAGLLLSLALSLSDLAADPPAKLSAVVGELAIDSAVLDESFEEVEEVEEVDELELLELSLALL